MNIFEKIGQFNQIEMKISKQGFNPLIYNQMDNIQNYNAGEVNTE